MNKEQKVFETLINKLKTIPYERWGFYWNNKGNELTYKHDFDCKTDTGVVVNYHGILHCSLVPLQEINTYKDNKLVYSFKFENENSPAKELFDYLKEGYILSRNKFEERQMNKTKKEETKEKHKKYKRLKELESILA